MADRNLFAQTIRIEIPAEMIPADETPQPKSSTTVRLRRAVAAATPPELRIKAKLSDSEYTLYHEFMQSIYDAAIITDMTGSIIDANIRALEFFLYSITDISAMTIFEIIYGFDPAVLTTVRENLANERFTLIEAYCTRKNRTRFPSEIATSQLHFGDEPHLCFFVRDITKRKESEEDLRKTKAALDRAERLEMAGSIAGHIAHDFNNLLTPLLAYPDFIREALPEGCQARQDLAIIEKTAQQIADINQQLLALSRRGYHEQTVININSIVEDVVVLLRRGGQAGTVAFKLEPANDLMNIKGASEQLLRVIQNLCQNAIEAMDGHGVLTIHTENKYLDEPLKRYESVAVGEYIQLSITDTGHGIPSDIRDRIFDPFFTTKKATRQRGSGLGLSVVHGIVKDHNGYIDVESTVKKGTTFRLYFPTCRDEAPIEQKAQQGGTENVMVVDDDSLQIEVTSRILAKLGYSVLSAKSGEEAVRQFELLQKSKKFPDLVILDMIMGAGMNGAESFQRMKEINPDQKALILSGYAESASVTLAQSLGAGTYLRKPVSIDKLSRAIRTELDRV